MSAWIVASAGAAALAAGWVSAVTLPRRRAELALRADLAAGRRPDPSVVDAIRLRSARVEVLYEVTRSLFLDDRHADAVPVLIRLAEDDPLAAGGRAAALLQTRERAAMEPLVRRALAERPQHAPLREAYARALDELGEHEAALEVIAATPVPDPDLALLRAEILEHLGRTDEATDIHRTVAASGLPGYSERAAHQVALADADDGEVVRALAGVGALAAGAWSNHLAVGLEQRNAATAPLVPFAPIRGTADAMEHALIDGERHPGDPLAWCALGLEELRHGDLPRAIALFRRASEQAPHVYAAQLGLAAALQLTEQGVEPLHSLPAADLRHAPRFADWDALTELERRVVAASVGPLERWLPALDGAPLRILPLTARVEDLPDGEILAGFVQDLHDVHPEHGWSVAGCLAHAVFHRMADADRLVVLQALDETRALPAERRVPGLELEQLDQFFGRAVAAWLSVRHRTGAPLLDVPPSLRAWFGP